MNKSQRIRLILLICFIIATIAVIGELIFSRKTMTLVDDHTWQNIMVLALLLLVSITYFLVFSFIPPIQNKLLYKTLSIAVYIIITIYLFCFAYTELVNKSTGVIIIIALLSLLVVPGLAILMRKNLKYYEAVLMLFISVLLYVLYLGLSDILLRSIVQLPFVHILPMMHVCFVIPVILILLVLNIVGFINKPPFPSPFMLLIATFPPMILCSSLIILGGVSS